MFYQIFTGSIDVIVCTIVMSQFCLFYEADYKGYRSVLHLLSDGPEVFFKTCVAMKLVHDDDDDGCDRAEDFKQFYLLAANDYFQNNLTNCYC